MWKYEGSLHNGACVRSMPASDPWARDVDEIRVSFQVCCQSGLETRRFVSQGVWARCKFATNDPLPRYPKACVFCVHGSAGRLWRWPRRRFASTLKLLSRGPRPHFSRNGKEGVPGASPKSLFSLIPAGLLTASENSTQTIGAPCHSVLTFRDPDSVQT